MRIYLLFLSFISQIPFFNSKVDVINQVNAIWRSFATPASSRCCCANIYNWTVWKAGWKNSELI